MTKTATDTDAMTMAGLNLIQQALTIYDSDLRLAVCNRPFPGNVRPARRTWSPRRAISRTRSATSRSAANTAVEDVEAFVRARVETARAFEPHYMERTRATGRTISVEGSPLPQGGWVTVYTDITRTKRQEALLRARSEELSDQLAEPIPRICAAANRELQATITALEEAKRQMTASEARTRLTAEMMPAHIAHVGPRPALHLFQPAAEYGHARLRGPRSSVPIAEALGPAGHGAIREPARRAFDGHRRCSSSPTSPARAASAWPSPPIRPGGRLYPVDGHHRRGQTRAALQQTRRREMAAQLTSGLAHDFSNLLTIILGMQSRLQRMGLPDEARRPDRRHPGAARRGGGLLDRIADMTGPREHEPVPTDLPAFLGDLETLARSTLPERVPAVIDNRAPRSGRFLLDHPACCRIRC